MPEDIKDYGYKRLLEESETMSDILSADKLEIGYVDASGLEPDWSLPGMYQYKLNVDTTSGGMGMTIAKVKTSAIKDLRIETLDASKLTILPLPEGDIPFLMDMENWDFEYRIQEIKACELGYWE